MHFTIRLRRVDVVACVSACLCVSTIAHFPRWCVEPLCVWWLCWAKNQTFHVQMPVHRLPSTWNDVQHFCYYLKKYQHVRSFTSVFWFCRKILCVFSRSLAVYQVCFCSIDCSEYCWLFAFWMWKTSNFFFSPLYVCVCICVNKSEVFIWTSFCFTS